MLGRIAQNLGAVAVGEDEAAFLGEDLRWHARMGGEEEAVGVQPVIRPFAVDAKILDRGFDLDDPDVALPGQRHKVGAPPGGQRQFGQHMHAHLHKQPLHATPHQHGAFRLAAIDQGIEENRGDDRHGSHHARFCSRFEPMLGQNPIDKFGQIGI
ncbi:hypothetical protein X773_28310 [Mesorhizobium sp. LSJC285A00]|nr:hypothetical protein X773_28310 [Mesorhizobium sp. LSJC285A00]